MLGLVDSLQRTARHLCWTPSPTLWSTYVDHSNYTAGAQEQKQRVVAEFLDIVGNITHSHGVGPRREHGSLQCDRREEGGPGGQL